MAQFSANAQRFDPYKNFKFRVKWDGRYVAGVSKVSALKRSTEVVEHREGGDPSSSLGVSTTTGTPDSERWASSSANGAAPMDPAPMVVCRSRFEPDVSRESLACTNPSRPGPTVAVSASRVAVIPPGVARS